MTPSRPLFTMIASAANVVGLRFGGAAIGFVTQIILARLLPQADVGVVFLAMSATSILSLIATLGYPSLALTSTARYVALGRNKLLDAFKRVVFRDAVLASAGICVGVAVAAFLPIDPSLQTALVFGCLSLLASAMLRINSALANSQRRFVLSYLPDFLIRPGLLMLYLLALWAAGIVPSVAHVLWVFTAVNTIVAFGQAFVMGNDGILPVLSRVPHGLDRLLRSRALALVIVFAVSSAFADLVTMIGSFYLSTEDVAVLAISVRLAALAGFVTQATQQLVLPDLLDVLVRNVTSEVRRLLLRVNLVALVAVGACVIGAVAAGPWILAIFGEGYARGHWPLVLFMISQMFRAASGLNQHLLSISGFQTKTASACLLSAALLLAGASLLTPRFGINGLAVAVILADALWAMLLAMQAQRFAGHRGDIAGLLWGAR